MFFLLSLPFKLLGLALYAVSSVLRITLVIAAFFLNPFMFFFAAILLAGVYFA